MILSIIIAVVGTLIVFVFMLNEHSKLTLIKQFVNEKNALVTIPWVRNLTIVFTLSILLLWESTVYTRVIGDLLLNDIQSTLQVILCFDLTLIASSCLIPIVKNEFKQILAFGVSMIISVILMTCIVFFLSVL
ncbi:hypothetical protein P261_01302 [Lachnospiraceae bacterium TWA4]|nr:hypothetical protein P261_01302 [Lachnospiraceae bacterium TWA4]